MRRRQVVVLDITYEEESNDQFLFGPASEPAEWRFTEMLDEPDVKVIASGPVETVEDEKETSR